MWWTTLESAFAQSGLERHERSEPVDLFDEFHNHQLHQPLLSTR
jgi:hypothetical protein